MKKLNLKLGNNRNGITLIALVITIIVLLILAGVTIATLTGDNGIIAKAQRAKEETEIGAEKELISLAILSTKTTKPEGNLQLAEIVDEINKNGTKVEIEGRKIVFTETNNMYKIRNGTVLEAGKKVDFESILTNYEKETTYDVCIGADGTIVDLKLWNLTKSNDGYYILDDGAYIGECKDGKIIGSIPQYIKISTEKEFKEVQKINQAFSNCKLDLRTMPQIPSTVRGLYFTFADCANLETVCDLPSSVKSLDYAFINCRSLKQTPEMSDSIEIMTNTFNGCSNLKTICELSNNLTNMQGTFAYCTNLTSFPVIPNSVTNMQQTFIGCLSLQEISIKIPENVTDISNCFENCTSLSGNITILSIPEKYDRCFYFTSSKENCILIVNAYESIIEEIINTKTSENIVKGNILK